LLTGWVREKKGDRSGHGMEKEKKQILGPREIKRGVAEKVGILEERGERRDAAAENKRKFGQGMSKKRTEEGWMAEKGGGAERVILKSCQWGDAANLVTEQQNKKFQKKANLVEGLLRGEGSKEQST